MKYQIKSSKSSFLLISIFNFHFIQNSITLFLFLFLTDNTIISQPSDYLKGKAFEIKNQPDSAIFYYSKILEKSKSDSKIYLERGKVYYQMQNFSEAIDDYNKANKIAADVADFELSQCYARLGDLNQTIILLKKHLTSKYKFPQVLIRMDKAFSRFENNKDWIDLWKDEWYDKYDSQVGEARFMANNNDWLGVINFISDILKNDSKHHELFYYRAKAFYEMNNYNTAMNDYSKAIEVNKHHYEYFEGRAETYIKLNKNKEASIDFSKAINLAPDEFRLYLKRAESYLLLGNNELAKADVDFYLILFDEDSAATYLAGRIAFASENYLTALTNFNHLISSYAQTARYYLSRGETYEKTGMSSNALKDYNSCLNIEPDNIVALRKRGQLLLNKGEKKAACQDFKKAMNLGDFQSNNLFLDNCR